MYHYTIVSTPIVTLQDIRDQTTIFGPKYFLVFDLGTERYIERRERGKVFITSLLMILMGKIFLGPFSVKIFLMKLSFQILCE